MHEFAITKELMRISREFIKEKKINEVKEVILNLGEFSNYESESIKYYFDELKLGGKGFSESKIVINKVPGNEFKLVSIKEK